MVAERTIGRIPAKISFIAKTWPTWPTRPTPEVLSMTAVRTPFQLDDPALFRTQLFLGGEWVDGNGSSVEVLDPATGLEVATMSGADAADVHRAIDCAVAAFPAWAGLTAPERARILRRWYDLIVEHADDLARILTAEQGKPLAEAKGEILYGAGFVEWYAEEAKRTYGDVIPTNNRGRRLMAIRQPVGVTAAITPWNFPSAMILRKAAPALAAGCPMIIKPAEETPLSATALAELAHRAGVPAGVLSVVVGEPAPIGDVLTAHPAVRTLSFTGSTAVGKLLMGKSAGTVKRMALELGGNAPFIVFDDADLDAAVSGAIASKFRNAGQTCVCANRLIVQAGIHDRFVAHFTAAVEKLVVGNGFDTEVRTGSVDHPGRRRQGARTHRRRRGRRRERGHRRHPAPAGRHVLHSDRAHRGDS